MSVTVQSVLWLLRWSGAETGCSLERESTWRRCQHQRQQLSKYTQIDLDTYTSHIWGSKTLGRCMHNSKCESQPALPHFQAVSEMKELFVRCGYLSEDTQVGWRATFLPTCQHFSLRIAVSKGNAKHMPMKWPKGLTITVMVSSVAPSTLQGFCSKLQSGWTASVRCERRNIGRKSLLLCQ